jgi:hypothetical protein
MTSPAAAARRLSFLLLAAALALGACTTRSPGHKVDPVDATVPPVDLGTPDLGPVDMYRPPVDMPFDPDMACTSASSAAVIERLPADIIWVVDNSASLSQEIENVQAGINSFADYIAATGVDYRVIMLSKRGVGASGSIYQICVPPPLAGDAACGNGARFFHSNIEILSTQPLEQILGTLGQTTGYGPLDARGGEPWRDWLRPGASKMFVVVTDDNARLSPSNFEHFRGTGAPHVPVVPPPPGSPPEWTNPATVATTLFLPPGILEPEWGGIFDGYKMSAIYGYDAGCTTASSPGPTYTELVTSTGGVRADICAPPAAWGTFFEQIATEVVASTGISCELAVPPPPDGLTFSPGRINVQVVVGGVPTLLYKTVDGLAGCASAPNGWYYDDEVTPTKVILCPGACDLAQGTPGTTDTRVDVQFGCQTIFG